MSAPRNMSFDRGITIMETMAKLDSCSLADLHHHTGIPKSSIRRLLGTLAERRLARRSLSDGRYRLNCALPVTVSEPIAPKLAYYADLSLPYLIELTRKLKWPSDIHIFDGNRIDVVDSTRPLSPFHIYAGLVSRRINLFGSAAGQACLSCLPNEKIVELERKHADDAVFGLGRFSINIYEYLDIIEKTRCLGYATRLGNFRGETIRDDGLSSMALPLLREQVPIGAASVIWPRVLMSPQEFAKSALPVINATIDKINKEIARQKA
jgi:IclR family mhp operon transcriptional activator